MAESSNRHASNLELFLDLVFVFSVTQVTSFVADNLSAAGVGKGVLVGFLVWWQWTAFTWAGTAIDLQSDIRARILVLAMVPAMLVMAISVPRALSGQGVWFASAYCVVQLFVLSLQGLEARGDEHNRRAFLRYAPLAAIAPSLLLVGSFLHGRARLAVWVVVALVMVGSALLAAATSEGEWAIDPTHFAERHALFVIITLGEVVVAIGATTAAVSEKSGLDFPILSAVVASAAVACVLWWAYFGFVPAVIELKLDEAIPSERGRIARDVGSFGHFPLVFGLILYAVVAKHLIKHADEHLAVADRWALFGAVTSFVGGQLAIQYRLVRRFAPERLLALVAVAALAGVSGLLPAALVVGLVAVVLAAMAVVTARRFHETELAQLVNHSL